MSQFGQRATWRATPVQLPCNTVQHAWRPPPLYPRLACTPARLHGVAAGLPRTPLHCFVAPDI